MKDRLVTFALAMGALALFYALIAPRPATHEDQPTRPTSVEAGPNGYRALRDWLSAGGVEVVSLRERYKRLASAAPAPSGNLLITTTPHLLPTRGGEIRPLRRWVEQGNTLLVLAGLSDTPEWSMEQGGDAKFFAHLQELTGLTFTRAAKNVEPQGEGGTAAAEEAAVAARQRLPEPLRFELKPSGAHPLLSGVRSLHAQSEYPTDQWFANVQRDRLLLELASEPDSQTPALWLLRQGDGQLILGAYGSLFTNKMLGAADNAQLLANVVRWSLAPDGRVLIDDAHQGLASFYDKDAFYRDPRLHATLWWLFALWLVFVLGPRRLRAMRSRWTPIDVTSFVRASGGFMARVLRPAEAAKRLFGNFFDDIRRRCGLPADGSPMWDWMLAHTTAAAADVARLQQLHARALRGGRVDLRKLQTLLAQLRREIS